jgi:dCMP deaminase
MSVISDSWHNKYLALAEHIASWSKDPSSKIGAVAIGRVGQILSTGYNGFPRGVIDTDERLNDREQKYPLTVHAETNCIYNATYNGVSLDGATLYVNGLPPCSEGCAQAIIQVGIKEVIIPSPHEKVASQDKWRVSYELTKQLFYEGYVNIIEIDQSGRKHEPVKDLAHERWTKRQVELMQSGLPRGGLMIPGFRTTNNKPWDVV